MEAIVIEIPGNSLDTVDASVRIEQFDGKVQIVIAHDFAQAAVVIDTLDQTQKVIEALSQHHDDLVWEEADRLIKSAFPTATGWVASWQGYDDGTVGGDWWLMDLEVDLDPPQDGQDVLESEEGYKLKERVDDLLGGIERDRPLENEEQRARSIETEL